MLYFLAKGKLIFEKKKKREKKGSFFLHLVKALCLPCLCSCSDADFFFSFLGFFFKLLHGILTWPVDIFFFPFFSLYT